MDTYNTRILADALMNIAHTHKWKPVGRSGEGDSAVLALKCTGCGDIKTEYANNELIAQIIASYNE